MSDHEVMNIRAAFNDVRTGLADLKDSLRDINALLNTERYISTEMIDAVDSVMKRYREQASALESIGTELSVPIGEDITEIENAIKLYEQKLSTQYLRGLVLDYFRLTAEAADIKMALEESKRRLVEKCALDDAQLPSAIKPYGAVVSHIRSGAEELSDDDYKLVHDEFGLTIVRAVDRGKLSIDADYNISGYLDDSCPLLSTNDEMEASVITPSEDNDSQEQVPQDEEEADISEPQVSQEVEMEEDEAGHDNVPDNRPVPESAETDIGIDVSETDQGPALSGYRGIAMGVSIAITGNAPASTLKAGGYKNLCKEKPEVPVAMFWIGHEKLQEESQSMDSAAKYYAGDPAIIEYLHNHEYLASFALESNLLSKRYLTLSEKGWASYTKQEVVKFLSSEMFVNKERARGLVVPDFIRSSAETWDDQTSLSIAFIHEFFANYHRNYQVYKNAHSGLVCADLIGDDAVRVCSGIFVEGTEQENLRALKEQLSELQRDDAIVLIVYSEQDIGILTEVLEITSPSVVFSVVEDEYKMLTSQGEDGFVKGISIESQQSTDLAEESEAEKASADEDTTISPRTSLKPVKMPSEQKLRDVLRANQQVTYYMFEKLAFVGLESEAHVHKILDEDCDSNYISQQINTLENKGYLSVYSYQGENIIAITPLTYEVMVKPSFLSMLKRMMKPGVPAKPSFVASNEIKLSDFKAHYDMAKRYLDIIDDLNERKANLSVLRTGTWLHDDRYFVFNRKAKGQPDKRLHVVSADEYLSFTPAEGEGLICRAEKLPSISSTEGDYYYCMCQDVYVWDGSKWINTVNGEEPPAELRPHEHKPVIGTEKSTAQSAKPVVSPSAEVVEAAQDETPIQSYASEDADIAEIPETPPVVVVDPSERLRIKQYLDAAWHMVKAGRTDVAAVMLKSLVYRDPELKTLADQFAYASGDPAINGSPNSKALGAVFSMPAGQDAVTDTYAVAAYLRMYFSSAAGDQTYMSRDFTHQKDNLALKRFPDLNDVLHDLSRWVKYQYRGLDAELIELLLRGQDTGVRQRALQQRAQDLLNSHLTESSHSNKRIKRTREILFASGSAIWKTLTGIKESNPETRSMAEAIVKNSIDKTIDDAWDEATRQLSYSRNEKCVGVERATLTRQLRNITTLITEWLSVNTAESRISNAQTQAAEQLIQNLRPKMEAGLQKLNTIDSTVPMEQQAAEAILRDTVKQCLDRITGASTQEAQARDYYIALLKEPLIALDDLDQPHIETPEEEIEPYDFCRRAMEYLDAPERSWDYVLKRIFNETGNDHMGMDYGCAKVIQQYLTECGNEDAWKSEYDIEAAVKDALDPASVRRNAVAIWEREFTARLEMAEGDNWFEADQSLRGHIQKVIGRQKETYYYADNFGFYGRAMNRLFERLRNRAQGMRARYNEDYAKLINGRSEEELSQPIFDQIKDMINNDRFGAAASFMQQVRNGNLTIGNGELTSGTLQDFIDRLNDKLYQNARLDTRRSLSAVFEGMHRKLANATLKTGDILLKAWPEGNTLQGDKIKTFFTEMDLPVNNVTGQDAGFMVTFLDRGTLWDYPHPMADFGSRMDERGIDVALISGNQSAAGYHTEIDKLLRRIHNNDRPLMLFVNSAIAINDRRKLAKSISRLTSSKPFILLDRCLALYLADTPKTDRWKTLLRCSLPFRVINPYYENSTLPIPPDMFIGRRKEIQGIIAPDGPNLVYGGRQLGKTAILRRVEFLRNHPAEGTWASYVDIRDMNHEDAVSTIGKALVRNGFLPTNAKPKAWKELVDMIESQLMDNASSESHSLLLMLDEADHILKLFEDENFQTLGDMKRLQQVTNGRFKFVLAGLHNVLRFSNSEKALGGNSVLPHLGGITIQPMKFSDGRELLEVPLSYLGFTIDQGQEDIIAQILYNTNYFPGLIHFYARRLVEHMKEISPELTMPPYKLSRDVLLRMIGEESFRKQRTEKLMMTLRVDEKDQDPYYYILAYALAVGSYDSDDVLLHGASAGAIKALCTDWSVTCRIGRLTDQQVEALLDELVILNILRQEESQGVKRYMFSRSSFLEMLGNEEEVLEAFLNILDKEAKRDDAR